MIIAERKELNYPNPPVDNRPKSLYVVKYKLFFGGVISCIDPEDIPLILCDYLKTT